MARDLLSQNGAITKPSAETRGKARKDTSDSQPTEFAPSEGADFQFAIGTATSIAGLTAFAMPVAGEAASKWLPDGLVDTDAAPARSEAPASAASYGGAIAPAMSTEFDSAPVPAAARAVEKTTETIILPDEPAAVPTATGAEPVTPVAAPDLASAPATATVAPSGSTPPPRRICPKTRPANPPGRLRARWKRPWPRIPLPVPSSTTWPAATIMATRSTTN